MESTATVRTHSVPVRSPFAEQLKARGSRTGAFVSSFVLDHRWGLDQGFEVYHDPGIHPGQLRDRESIRRSADSVVNDALDWMQQLDGSRFFAWLHFYDAHAPARPPAEFAPIGTDDDYFPNHGVGARGSPDGSGLWVRMSIAPCARAAAQSSDRHARYGSRSGHRRVVQK
jgi:hypothetical protein